jgi:dihydroflavonol-4-reductase
VVSGPSATRKVIVNGKQPEVVVAAPTLPARSLVTGGTGFIGRHVVSALLRRGDFVRVLDCAVPFEPLPGVEFIHGSILDCDAVDRALDGIDNVFHLAAIAHLWTPDVAAFDVVNRQGTETMLAAAADRRVRRFVHCSTETVLLPPRGAERAVDEATALTLADMAGPYSRSKYLAEQAAIAAARDGLPVVIVNPTLPIGRGDRRFTPPTAMLALYLRGTSRFFLDCVLNLVDVRDVAAGMLLAGERGRPGERYILGGENMWLRQVATMLGRMSGRETRKWSVPGALALAAGHVGEWVADNITHRPPIANAEGVRLALRSAHFDNAKARRELGYAPRPVLDAMKNAASWILSAFPPDSPVPIESGIARRPVTNR